MPQRRNNPNNQFVKKADPGTSAVDEQPWNKSRIEIEPAQAEEQAAPPAVQGPRERFSDRIKYSPMDEQGRATDKALKGWTGIKRA